MRILVILFVSAFTFVCNSHACQSPPMMMVRHLPKDATPTNHVFTYEVKVSENADGKASIDTKILIPKDSKQLDRVSLILDDRVMNRQEIENIDIKLLKDGSFRAEVSCPTEDARYSAIIVAFAPKTERRFIWFGKKMKPHIYYGYRIDLSLYLRSEDVLEKPTVRRLRTEIKRHMQSINRDRESLRILRSRIVGMPNNEGKRLLQTEIARIENSLAETDIIIQILRRKANGKQESRP